MSEIVAANEVPVPHNVMALRLLENLRAMQGSIDGFVMPPTPMDAHSRPRGHRVLPTPFFVALAVALESHPQFLAVLQAATNPLTPADIRDMLRYEEALLPLAEELERFARGIRHSVSLRRAKVGRMAAAAYRMVDGLNVLVDTSLPIPEVEAMKRAVSRRRKKPAEPVPAPVPVVPKTST